MQKKYERKTQHATHTNRIDEKQNKPKQMDTKHLIAGRHEWDSLITYKDTIKATAQSE